MYFLHLFIDILLITGIACDSLDIFCDSLKATISLDGIGLYRDWQPKPYDTEADLKPNYKIYLSGRNEIPGQEWTLKINSAVNGSQNQININGDQPVVMFSKNIICRFNHPFGESNYSPNRKCNFFDKSLDESRTIKNGEFGLQCCCKIDDQINQWTEYELSQSYTKDTLDIYNITAFNPIVGYSNKPQVLLLNRFNKKLYFYIINENRLEEDNCGKSCPTPKFVQQLDDKYFTKELSIVAITDFWVGNKKGHLIVFNKNGKAFYCFTYDNENLSPNCKPESLKQFMEHCFDPKLMKKIREEEANIGTTETVGLSRNGSQQTAKAIMDFSDDKQSDSSSSVLPIILAIVAIIVIALLIIYFFVFRKKQKKSQTRGSNNKKH